MQLTSTTAPNKIFLSREELSQHYKSDWHRYNLKRKEAGLPAINEEEFRARLEAAVALRREKEKVAKKDHLKDKSGGVGKKAGAAKSVGDAVGKEEETEEREEECFSAEINPRWCLFCTEKHSRVKSNLNHMKAKHSFFLPDMEYLVDLEGLIGYCSEKIIVGHICLYCQKAFATDEDTRRHMHSKNHCKIRYEEGVDLDEFQVFYDFSAANQEFLGRDDPDDHEQDDEWTDASSSEDDHDQAPYEDAIARHGFGITELGELILPNGQVIGHRALSRYYKQRLSPSEGNHPAKLLSLQHQKGAKPPNVALGNGILVPSAHGPRFTSLSLYRYRALVKKQRREESKAHRDTIKTKNPINKMDKKANRLMNGVSVAHAAR